MKGRVLAGNGKARKRDGGEERGILQLSRLVYIMVCPNATQLLESNCTVSAVPEIPI